MISRLFSQIYSTVIFLISIIACLWLIISYSRLPVKSFVLQLIVILCTADIIYYIGQIIYTWSMTGLVGYIGAAIWTLSGKFAIFWSTSIAFFVYRSVRSPLANPAQYRNWSIVINVLLASSISLL